MAFSERGRIAFDRNELAGAFGDLGTDLPLVMAMIAVNGLDVASTFILFGVLQVLTGLVYRLPMPVQPLKAIAAIMITMRPDPALLYGAGLALGVGMLLLSLSGTLTRLHRLVPLSVVRGIQFGLGLTLAILAMGFMLQEGAVGIVLAGAGVVLVLALHGSRRLPAALVLVAIGVAFGIGRGFDPGGLVSSFGLSLPVLRVPAIDAIVNGSILLAAPQLPLSLANSVIAISLLVRDLYPTRRDVTVRKIGLTYGMMNVVSPFFSGIPVCHGAGGAAGHHRFGARTGGSVIIEGATYALLGLFFAGGVGHVVGLFPFPILGVLLLFEGFALMQLLRHVSRDLDELYVALAVGAVIVGLPYGYLIGLVGGTILFRALKARKRGRAAARPSEGTRDPGSRAR